ncbi:MAG: hypothetical protein EXR74_05060 [Bdellovibrionales bacterium]|nr:hypothetical protein [Bdellovibrionales bacterium]
MSLRSNLKVDFSKWANHPSINSLTRQITTYEKRVSSLVKGFDIKGREARKRSRKQLDKVLVQLKQTRANVEKRVSQLVSLEGKKLNKRVNELVSYLKVVSRKEARTGATVGRAKTITRVKKSASRIGKTRPTRTIGKTRPSRTNRTSK